MLSQVVRASRLSAVRVARQQILSSQRTFVTSATRQADLVQDLYLKELKAYKNPQVKASDAEGHVQKFSVPKAPRSPEESDLASDLKAYETQQVEVEGQAEAGSAAPAEHDWFEEEDYSDEPAAHH